MILPIVINAKTISDAWFQLLFNIFDNSYTQHIQSGSFEKEQYRLQYPGAAISIEFPHLDMVPIIPEGLGIPSPTSQETIENYFANYIMDPGLAENETYKYASRIKKQMPSWAYQKTQLDMIIGILKRTPMTNQAVLEIATPTDIVDCVGNDGKLDPPCLRLIDFKVLPMNFEPMGTVMVLTMSVYFRSWDLWAGLPTNLGGLELLKQYVADECGLVNGPMYAYSSGLHIYGYQEDIARIRTFKRLGVK
jgi:thymidylate synthase